ncbi:MAG: hypothetical protein QM820_41830 [Minicystis sp.]
MNARRPGSNRRAAALRFPLISLLLSVGATLLVFAGCGLNTHGTGNGGNGGGPTVPCNVDDECDDDNPCTKDSCGADKTCAHQALADGPAPNEAQTSGDCTTVMCEAGKPKDVAQDDDIPDDNKPCTIDSCADKVASHVPVTVGMMCDDGMGNNGRCDAQGNCKIACTTSSMCTSTSPCVTPSCDTSKGECVFPALADGTPTPGAPVVAGDCKVSVCVGGMNQDLADDSDLPTVGDCRIAACDQGTPAPQPKPTHTGCASYMGNSPGYCDGAGTCQQCTQDSDCASTGPTNDCQKPVCNNNKCQQEFTPVNTPTTTTPAQAVGDCQKSVCDGAGNVTLIADNGDPQSDGNECTLDQCAGANMTNHPNAPDMTTKCGTGMALACFGGQCVGCTMDNQCAPASCSGTVLTKSQTCNLGNGKCNTPTPQDCAPYNCVAALNACPTKCNADTDCVTGYYCTGTNGTCQQKAPQGGTCMTDHQCTTNHCVDGFCCDTTCTNGCDACSNAKTGAANGTCSHVTVGTDPNNVCNDQGATSCGTNGVCDGLGACQKYPSGTVCAGAACNSNTLTKQKTCNGSGTCVTPNPATQGCSPYLCVAASNACTTTCSVDNDCFTGNWCNAGTCTAKLANGSTCTGANQCTNGSCVDGYCCNNACNTACQACSAAKKQSGAGNGTCGNAKTGQADPRGVCTTTAQTSCGQDGLCNAGACEKWPTNTVCANASCSGNTLTAAKTCDGNGACNQGGTTSTCANGLACDSAAMMCFASCGMSTMADDSKCVGGDYCDPATGACKLKIATGAMGCSTNSQCQSGFCGVNNGVCCSADCPDDGAATCGKSNACAMTTGACLFYDNMTTCSATTCPAGGNTFTTQTTCNGSGTCSGNAMNGTCPSSLKCNAAGTACLTACGSASAAGDANCVSTSFCDGANGGACQAKKTASASCTRDGECISNMCHPTMMVCQ